MSYLIDSTDHWFTFKDYLTCNSCIRLEIRFGKRCDYRYAQIATRYINTMIKYFLHDTY